MLNVLGENEKPFREFIQSALKKPGGSISASITLTNQDGEVKHFNCACLQSPQATPFKNVVDVVPVVSSSVAPTEHESPRGSPLKNRRNSSPKALPRKLSMTSLPTEYAITSNISSAISNTITVNLPESAPVYKITPVSTGNQIATVTAAPLQPSTEALTAPLTSSLTSLSSTVTPLTEPIAPITINPNLLPRPTLEKREPKKINLNFPSLALTHSALTAAAAVKATPPDEKVEELTPASSPEIIVDEVTPEATVPPGRMSII